MYWLIENDAQLQKLKEKQFKDVFIEIIPSSPTLHPVENGVSCLYLHPLYYKTGYIINISHDEGFKLNIDTVKHFLNEFNTVYTKDKKEFLHYFVLFNLKDITFDSPKINIDVPRAYSFIHNNNNNKILDINNLVPLTKHYEYGFNLYETLKSSIKIPINDFYNKKTTLVFNYIEKAGIKIDKEKFEKHFKLAPIGDKIYTRYNLKTLTKRPSNHFNHINFAALNKTNGERSCFIPENNYLIEIDIRAYHPSLLADLVGYEFQNEDIHLELSKLYNVDYKSSKKITFQQIYGGIFPQYEHLEFFSKVKTYTNELWEDFNNKGEIICPYSNYSFKKADLEDMNPQKLLNYLLQNLETSLNVTILWEMIKLLNNRKTKLVLYVYDSFLFDFNINEKDLIQDIIQLFKKYNLNIKLNRGINYDFK